MQFIDLKAQYEAYKDEINKATLDVFNSGQFIGGEALDVLTKKLEQYTGSKYVLPVSNGTDALVIALRAFDIKQGDEVIVPSFTFIATAEAVALVGAKPIFVDICKDTYNIDALKIKDKIKDKTKAIIPVSLYGQPADMDEINLIAKEHHIKVIEDGAQSFGSRYKDRLSCNLSDIGCTSFFPSKPLGCYGDGGAIFTNDQTLYEKMKMIANHGQKERYIHETIGMNARLDAVQAAILSVKLKYFNSEVQKRQEIANEYTQALKNIVKTPAIKDDRSSVFAQYSIEVDNRDRVVKDLAKLNIPTAIHYPIALNEQKVFSENKDKTPIASKVSKQILSIPMSPFLTKNDQKIVIEGLRRII